MKKIHQFPTWEIIVAIPATCAVAGWLASVVFG
jgi:hypothetical protein